MIRRFLIVDRYMADPKVSACAVSSAISAKRTELTELDQLTLPPVHPMPQIQSIGAVLASTVLWHRSKN